MRPLQTLACLAAIATASCTDDSGTGAGTPPKTEFTAPKDGATLTGKVALAVTAAGAAHMQFFLDGGLLVDDKAAPFQHDWDSKDADDGAHTLKAVAYASGGATGSATLKVTVDNTPPTVAFTLPLDNTAVTGTVTLAAKVEDKIALDKVEFSAGLEGSAATVVGSAAAAPFEVQWQTDKLPSGKYTLTATALDKAGNKATATRGVTIDRAPTVTITAPAAGEVKGTVEVTGKAEDDLGLQKGALSLDGAEIAAIAVSGKTAEFKIPWDTLKSAYGPHVLTATVTDSAGRTGSAEVKVTVPVTGTPGMVKIPGGSFFMGCTEKDPACQPTAQPQHELTVSPFELDVHEVSVEVYEACVAAGRCPVPEDVSAECNFDVKTKKAKPGKEKHPMNCVKWFYANAFCNNNGKRLPTEAEWELAARGDCSKLGATCAEKMPLYPWGDEWPPPKGAGNFADMSAKASQSMWNIIEGYDDGFPGAAPVGSFTANAYGIHDLAGNVKEWVGDVYVTTFYATSPKTNPQSTTGSWFKSVRGGDFHLGKPEHLRADRRNGIDPAAEDIYLGFRCAKTIPQ
jgi:formylglycine-generating enzyme required for sulfatase activity